MSVAEAFSLARMARSKLMKEASVTDPDLRHLIAHANLLDSLLLKVVRGAHAQRSESSENATKAAKAIEQKRMSSGWGVTFVDDIERQMNDMGGEGTNVTIIEDTGDAGKDMEDENPESTDDESDSDIMSDEEEYDDLLVALTHRNLALGERAGTPAPLWNETGSVG